MAAVTAAIVGATALTVTAVNSIEQGKQAKRLAGQAKDRANAAADEQQRELDLQEQKVKDTQARDQRISNRRRVAVGGSASGGFSAPSGTLLGGTTGGTLLGS